MAKYKIIPSSRTIVQSPISIGHKAEKGVEAIEFDLTAWVETYGSGTLTVIMRRWGDAIPYPIALEIDENNKATWTLSDIDTAKAGMAYAQLNYIVGDEVVKKSDIYTFRVMDSLTGEGDPPEAYESWLEHLAHLAAEAMAEVLDIEGIVTDKTLTVDGGIADAKATGDALALKADKSTTYTKTEVDQMIEDVEVETDTTLEIAGAPADAAETGRQIGLIKADLDAVDESVSQVVTTEDVPTEYTLIANSYVDKNGEFQPYSNWSRTDYIPVTPGATIKITSIGNSQYNYSYDANKQPIGAKWSITIGDNTIALRQDANYIVLSGQSAYMSGTVINLGDKNTYLNQDLQLTRSMVGEVGDIVDAKTGKDTFVNPTAYLMKQVIPNYYFARNETAESKHDIGYLDDKINSIPDGYHFMFVTDTHWNDNAKQCTKLISYVRDRIGAKIVLFGGDILTAHSTIAIAYRWLCDFVFDFKNAFGSNFLPVVGNHDLNAAGTSNPELTYADLVPVFTQGCDSRFHYCDFYDDRIDEMASSKGMTAAQVAAMKQYFRTCYYVDDVEGKTRFIVYNTGAGSGGSGIQQYIDPYISGSYEEMLVMEWVYDCLVHVPEGYNVILSTHIAGDFSWESDGGTFLADARKKFAAMVAGLKAQKRITVYLPNSITDYAWWGNSVMTFDYTNAPDVGVVLVMSGHHHVDKFGKCGFSNATYNARDFGSEQSDINATTFTCYQSATSYAEGEHFISEVPVVVTQHDAYIRNSGPNSHEMTLGTITEQVIDVVTITPEGNVAFTRIGAGNDRFLTIQ